MSVLPLVSIFLFATSFPITSAANQSNFSECSTQLDVLEDALFTTGDNIFELSRIFYPPSERTTRFIRVVYIFLDDEGEENGCNVTYFWAIGGFLLLQPPSLFRYNSLFFNYPNNDLTELDLKLPSACRPLIGADMSVRECSCANSSERLNILTQQVCSYIASGYSYIVRFDGTCL